MLEYISSAATTGRIEYQAPIVAKPPEHSIVPGFVCGIVSMPAKGFRAIQIAAILASRPVGLAAKRSTRASTESLPGPRIRISSPTKRKIKGSAL